MLKEDDVSLKQEERDYEEKSLEASIDQEMPKVSFVGSTFCNNSYPEALDAELIEDSDAERESPVKWEENVYNGEDNYQLHDQCGI